MHNAGLETLWTLVPVVYLGLALVHGIGVLYGMEGVRSYSAGSGKTIQVIGHQWYWEYVLGGCKQSAVESRMVGSNALDFGAIRVTTVDQPVYIGTNVAVQVGVTSVDVIHCWSVPGLGIKLDGIPGRMSMVGMQGLTPGVYSGYCAELCGSGHAFMPIQVVVYNSTTPSCSCLIFGSFFLFSFLFLFGVPTKHALCY